MKRGISSVVLTCMLLSSFVVCIGQAASIFPDLPQEHWAYDDVMALVEMGVISGYPDGSFAPEANVTRAEFAKMTTELLGLKEQQTELYYDDIIPGAEDDWGRSIYVGDVWYIKYARAVSGFLPEIQGSQSYFDGSSVAYRMHLIQTLFNVINPYLDYSYSASGFAFGATYREDVVNKFSDISENAHWQYIPYIWLADKYGIANGYSDSTFGAYRNVTRAEAAAIIMRFAKLDKSTVEFDQRLTRQYEMSLVTSEYTSVKIRSSENGNTLEQTFELSFPFVYENGMGTAKIAGIGNVAYVSGWGADYSKTTFFSITNGQIVEIGSIRGVTPNSAVPYFSASVIRGGELIGISTTYNGVHYAGEFQVPPVYNLPWTEEIPNVGTILLLPTSESMEDIYVFGLTQGEGDSLVIEKVGEFSSFGKIDEELR
jgi:hypothetical protein